MIDTRNPYRDNFVFTYDEVKELNEAYCVLFSKIKPLGNVLNESLCDKLRESLNVIRDFVEPYQLRSRIEKDQRYETIERLRKDNNFISVWSIDTVNVLDYISDTTPSIGCAMAEGCTLIYPPHDI